MVKYKTVNAKLLDSQLNKLKIVVKGQTGTTLRMNVGMVNGNNLPHELLVTTRQTTKLRNAIQNNKSTNIKLSKAQISKIIQSGGFLSKLLGPLLKSGLPLTKNVIKPLAKSVLIPLGLTAAASAADAGIEKKILGSGTTTLIMSNEEMNDILKIVQTLEDSNILLKGVTKTIKNETKEQKRGFLSILLGTLGASLLGNLLSGKGTVRAGEGIIRAGYGSSIKKSRDNLPKKINGSYVINLDEYGDAGTNWIALYVKNNEVIYFDSFGVEHVPKGIKRFIEHKDTKTNISRIQADNSVICGYFCTGFIDFN